MAARGDGGGDCHRPVSAHRGEVSPDWGCLEAFADRRSPIGLVTKGTLVVRDVDVLEQLSRRAECTVCFSVTTMDVELARKLEPGTPPPHRRLRAMERLVQAGVNAGVMLAPVLPGITDGPANLEGVARAAAACGARFLSANMLYLKPGTREHYLDFIRQQYLDLALDYGRLYPGAYSPEWMRTQIEAGCGSHQERLWA